jgi:hypothetical protein
VVPPRIKNGTNTPALLGEKTGEAQILTDDRSKNGNWCDSLKGNQYGLGPNNAKIGSWRQGLSPLGIPGGMVNDLGETEELLERFMAPRGPKKRQPGKEKM